MRYLEAILCPVPGFASVGVADIYSLQPLAGQPDTPKATPTAPPPVASVTPVQQVAANPYRLGQTGGKRVARGLAGVSVHATPPSQPLPQAPPPSLPPSLPTAVTPGPAQVRSSGVKHMLPLSSTGLLHSSGSFCSATPCGCGCWFCRGCGPATVLPLVLPAAQ